MADNTCKGCRYYECRYNSSYSSREVRHLCWVDPVMVERRRTESSEAPPACARRAE